MPYALTWLEVDLLRSIYTVFSMGGNRKPGERYPRHRGPDLPNRSRDRDSFQSNIPYPSGSETEFASRHADLYGEEEHLIDGSHAGRPYFPRRSERAKIHEEYKMSTPERDRTRLAYKKEFDAAKAEAEGFSQEQDEYYTHTSDGMLPRHHTDLLPLARAREEPTFQ